MAVVERLAVELGTLYVDVLRRVIDGLYHEPAAAVIVAVEPHRDLIEHRRGYFHTRVSGTILVQTDGREHIPRRHLTHILVATESFNLV